MERTDFSIIQERLRRKADLFSSRRKRRRIFHPIFRRWLGVQAHKRHNIKYTRSTSTDMSLLRRTRWYYASLNATYRPTPTAIRRRLQAHGLLPSGSRGAG